MSTKRRNRDLEQRLQERIDNIKLQRQLDGNEVDKPIKNKPKHGNKPKTFSEKSTKEITEELDGVLQVHDKQNRRVAERRDVSKETHKVATGNSAAFSSKKALYYHDIPPEFYRRVGRRHTVGHTKYNDDPIPITMNLNWRIGLDDPLYVMDRLNHMFEHIIDFLENGNTNDDNLGAIGWSCCFLMECERMHPEVFNQIWGQSKFSGHNAKLHKEHLQRLIERKSNGK